MNKEEETYTEHYLIIKGINSCLQNIDKLDIPRQILLKEYIERTKEGKTRISYLQKYLKL